MVFKPARSKKTIAITGRCPISTIRRMYRQRGVNQAQSDFHRTRSRSFPHHRRAARRHSVDQDRFDFRQIPTNMLHIPDVGRKCRKNFVGFKIERSPANASLKPDRVLVDFVLAGIDTPNDATVARDRAFVFKVRQAMVRQSFGNALDFFAFHRLFRHGKRQASVGLLVQKIPMVLVASGVMLQNDETKHGLNEK